jgi:hypothetical protein
MSKSTDLWEILVTLTGKEISLGEAHDQIMALLNETPPIGDVEILLIGLEHIGKWGEEEGERWDCPGECAMDTLLQYRYSMNNKHKSR